MVSHNVREWVVLALTGSISLIAAGYAAAGMFDLQLDGSEDGPTENDP